MSISQKSFINVFSSGETKCEFLVIGSGAGGSLSAEYLAKNGKEVLIAEEGPFLNLQNEDCRVVNAFPAIWRDGGAIPVLSNAKFLFTEGRVLGGSTMINAGLIGNLPEKVAEEWRSKYQIDGFDYKSFARYEDTIGQALGVKVLDDAGNRAGELMKIGASKLGYKGYDIPAAAGIKNGIYKKNNMQETFLKSAAEHDAKIIVNCKILKLLFRGKNAYAAKAAYTDSSGHRRDLIIYFNKVFVCAGSVQSALLLRRSGIKRNIGNSIRFHPYLRVVAEFEEEVSAYKNYLPSFQIKEFAPEISMGASISMPDFIASNLSLNFKENKDSIKNFRRMVIYYVGIRANANGTVRNLPFAGSSYLIRYNLNSTDLRNLSFGYAKLCRVLFASGAKKIFPAIKDVPHISSERESIRFEKENLPLRDLNLISLHSFSSCPMGEKRDVTAVGSYGKLHGFENMYINDASILPNAPGVNPQGPLMAMALRNLEKNFG